MRNVEHPEDFVRRVPEYRHLKKRPVRPVLLKLMLSESVALFIFTHESRIRWGVKSENISLMKGNKSLVFFPFVIKDLKKKVSREKRLCLPA
jgi:hypothetical protein